MDRFPVLMLSIDTFLELKSPYFNRHNYHLYEKVMKSLRMARFSETLFIKLLIKCAIIKRLGLTLQKIL